MLLIASCIFYMTFIPVYILILFVTIIIDYFAGIWIEQSEGKKKKYFLIGSIVSTCLVLFIFKYFNFFNSNFRSIADFFHWNYPIELINIILPIGLSFHTFQSLSYVIEVYRGNQKAERNFGIYSLYVMFFPQLVAGPIERPQNLLHQFYEEHKFDYNRVVDGLKLMAWGMFKKVVIADRLAVTVNQVYNNTDDYTGIPLIIATVFFAFQIYCDFSGYSDIAIGSAQVMGFKLMQNFNRPYFSKTISEFWKRWHISLSTWFKDYVYISLGGNRTVKWRWYYNLFITFLISGFWHGANWTFVFWGALHGFYLVFAIVSQKTRTNLNKATGLVKFPILLRLSQMITTFLLVCFAWIFFRANSISDAFYIISHLFADINSQLDRLMWIFYSLILKINEVDLNYLIKFNGNSLITVKELLISIGVIVFMETIHTIQRRKKVRAIIEKQPTPVRWILYYAAIIAIIELGVFGGNEFIYFQF